MTPTVPPGPRRTAPGGDSRPSLFLQHTSFQSVTPVLHVSVPPSHQPDPSGLHGGQPQRATRARDASRHRPTTPAQKPAPPLDILLTLPLPGAAAARPPSSHRGPADNIHQPRLQKRCLWPRRKGSRFRKIKTQATPTSTPGAAPAPACALFCGPQHPQQARPYWAPGRREDTAWPSPGAAHSHTPPARHTGGIGARTESARAWGPRGGSGRVPQSDPLSPDTPRTLLPGAGRGV